MSKIPSKGPEGPRLASIPKKLPPHEREQWETWEEERAQDLEQVRQMSRDERRADSLMRLAEERMAQIQASEGDRVDLQVTDVRHARSAEVLAFCLSHLGAGGTWSSLRQRLGLKPGDIRFRIIRERAVESLLPVNEDEAIKAVGSQRTYLVDKLEGMLEKLEARMDLLPEKTRSGFNDAAFWKIKTEIMKLLFEENSKNLMDHLEMKKAKAIDKMQAHGSIIVQNNYYIPRPGDSQDKLKDVTPIINELTETANKVEAALADSERLQTDAESTTVPRE